jgi:hypothetical protein
MFPPRPALPDDHLPDVPLDPALPDDPHHLIQMIHLHHLILHFLLMIHLHQMFRNLHFLMITFPPLDLPSLIHFTRCSMIMIQMIHLPVRHFDDPFAQMF